MVALEEFLAPWRMTASCREPGMPREWWYPETEPEWVTVTLRRNPKAKRASSVRAEVRRASRSGMQLAKAVCAACPARLDCLCTALAANTRDGVWGGVNMADRRQTTGLRQAYRMASTLATWALFPPVVPTQDDPQEDRVYSCPL